MSEPQFFETITKSFTEVRSDENGVNTADFCDASENLVKIFGLFGNPAFSVVQNDLTGNITKVRTYLLSNPDNGETLEKLLKTDQDKKATTGLLWLLRGLKFTALGLRENLNNPKEELSVSFTKGYEGSLKKHHGFAVKPIFYLAMKACPYRATFYPKLGQPQEVVQEKLQAWLSALEEIIKKEETSFKSGGYGEV